MNNNFSYNDFVIFVRAFQEMNSFVFEWAPIQQPDLQKKEFYCDALYRDEYNYKTNVQFHLNEDGEVSWSVWDGWDDAEDEIEELFEGFIKWKWGKRDDRFTQLRDSLITMPAQDEVLHNQDPHKLYVMEVYKKLTDQIERAENGQISFSEVFNKFSGRDFLPQYTIVPTSWHIDDIRDRFPEGTSNEELMVELLKIERVLSESAKANGWEVINDCLIQD
ncbi:hypothetical protein [Paenibacillus alvei]|uniref:hypothetical protein n=1 Tax=Paenibacillus alvei TaxID=44250 RepID=UPI00227E2C32|nr:hypothetical protein [Paenibacillus alvei]